MAIPVAARSKAWVCGAGIAGSNPEWGVGGCLDVCIVCVGCCQVGFSASD
jgi:hypothetical protein